MFSTLYLVYCLLPLSKCLRVHKGQFLPVWGLWTFAVCWGEGIIRVEPVEFIRLKEIKIWLCGERA